MKNTKKPLNVKRGGVAVQRMVRLFWCNVNRPLEWWCVRNMLRVKMGTPAWRRYVFISRLEWWTRQKRKPNAKLCGLRGDEEGTK